MSAGVRGINRTLQLRSTGSSTGLYAIPRYYTGEKYTFRNISARARTACRLNRFPVKINWISGRVSFSFFSPFCARSFSHTRTHTHIVPLSVCSISNEKKCRIPMALWYFCSRRRSCLFVRATGPYRGIRRLDRWADFNLYILHVRRSMISVVAWHILASDSLPFMYSLDESAIKYYMLVSRMMFQNFGMKEIS